MPCKGMAYCNRVQRLLFFPSIKVDGQPQRAAKATLFHCSQRNQKLLPGDAGPKTNALQPLLDRYETPLLCWKYWKRYQRQTVRLFWPLWKWLRVSPANATSVPIFYMQQKVCYCCVYVKFSELYLFLHKLRTSS